MSPRLPRKAARETVSALEAQGWRLSRHCGSGHIQLRHEPTSALLVVSVTPGGRCSRKQVLGDARRALRAWERGTP